MNNLDIELRKGSGLKALTFQNGPDQNASEPLFRVITVIKIVFVIILTFAILLAGTVIVIRSLNERQKTGGSAESNLGDSIIEANAIYAQMGGTFGKSTSETVREMQKDETFISIEAIYARNTNSVGVFDLNCNKAVGCQEVELVSIDLASSHCLYAKIEKTAAQTATFPNNPNQVSQSTLYGSRPLNSGETTCSALDKVSNWRENGFSPF